MKPSQASKNKEIVVNEVYYHIVTISPQDGLILTPTVALFGPLQTSLEIEFAVEVEGEFEDENIVNTELQVESIFTEVRVLNDRVSTILPNADPQLTLHPLENFARCGPAKPANHLAVFQSSI